MSFLSKPTWLTNPQAFQEVTKYNLYLPPEASLFFNIQDPAPLLTGMKQYLYWKGQLLSSLTPTTIFLAFLTPKGLVQPNVIELIKALKTICNMGLLIETYTGANSNFIAFSFRDSSPIEQILSNFTYFQDSIVLSVSQLTASDHRFRLLWLPPLFNISRVHHLLDSITDSHRIRRESIGIGGSEFSPTNVISGTISLKVGQSINNLPHLIKLPTPHKGCALLTIEGRDPLCLKCRAVGHTRRDCTMIKCSKCSKVHFPASPCGTSSYSSVASMNVTTPPEDDWLSQLSDTTSTCAATSLSAQDVSSTGLLGPFPADLSKDHLLSNPSHDNSTSTFPASHVFSTPNVDSFTANDFSTECARTTVVSSIHVAPVSNDDAPDSSLILQTSTPLNTSPSVRHRNKPHACISLALENSTVLTATTTPAPSNLPTPVANYTRSKSTSKVRVVSNDTPSSQAIRSETISYNPHLNISQTAAKDSLQPSISTMSGNIFGDPDLGHCFDSSLDSSQDEAMVLNNFDELLSDQNSRKRKGSSSSSFDEPAPLSPEGPSINIFSQHATSVTLPIFATDDIPLNLASSSSNLDSKSDLEHKISSLLNINNSQLTQLKDLCPNGVFTNDIFKALKLLSSHGLGFAQVISSSHILKLKFAELKRKVKFLVDHLGVINISDITGYSRIEDTFLAGGIHSSQGTFHVP